MTHLKSLTIIKFILVLSFQPTYAQAQTDTETVQGTNQGSLTSTDSSKPYGPYLNCLNKLPTPTRLEDVNSSNLGEPSENPTLFAYNFNGRIGIFFLNPNQAHFVTPIPYQNKNGIPQYSLLYKAPSAKNQLITGTTSINGSLDNPVSFYYDQDGIAKSLPSISYTLLGEPNQRISRTDALTVIEPAGEQFITALPNYYQNRLESDRIYVKNRGFSEEYFQRLTEQLQERVKDALCSCMKTQNTRLMQAVREASRSLPFIKDPEECAPALVSSFKIDSPPWNYLIPSASASEPKKVLAEIKPKWPAFALYKQNDTLTICGARSSMIVSFVDFSIIKQSGDCSAKALKAGSKVITYVRTRAEIKDYKVIFTKL